ncbi:hypothetical protein [Herbaspirillum rubrisubalbicans]|nr:hypothetical protein [Herbaspirillum rubrisubalbicans]
MNMNTRFDFAVAEALRRSLLDGWLLTNPADLSYQRRPSGALRIPEF